MKKRILLATLSLVFLNGSLAATNSLPQLDEVMHLLRTHGSGLTETELNRAAVQGLLEELSGQAILVTNATEAGLGENPYLFGTVSTFENAFGYFRVDEVEAGFRSGFEEGYKQLIATNKLKGLVIDLRYAGGTDYGAAAKIADLFIKSEQLLLQWDGGTAHSTGRANAITLPVAVLINQKTSGAAEVLAGLLRDAQVGLLIGANTAGRASVFQEFELKNGQKLKIATSAVKLGNGKEIPRTGLKPDIQVSVSVEEAKAYYEDPYRKAPQISLTGTNSVGETNRPRRRLNEAELVRLQREGLSAEEIFNLPPAEPTGPVLSDPILLRALDLLKGLAIVQQGGRF